MGDQFGQVLLPGTFRTPTGSAGRAIAKRAALANKPIAAVRGQLLGVCPGELLGVLPG